MDPIISRLPSTLIPGGELRICHHSGIAWQPDPQPITYDEAYFGKYVSYEGTDIAHDINYARMMTVFDLLGDRFDPRPDAPDTLVDVGIGSGEFLSYLIERQGRGHHLALYGYDVNAAGVEWLRERDLFCDIYHPAGAFSRSAVPVVTAWDVIEHIPEPAAFFATIPVGGYLCTSLPVYPEPIDAARIMASRHYKPNEHLYYFTRAGFTGWVERYGFDLLAYHSLETVVGRDAIGTFTFRRTRPQPDPVAVLPPCDFHGPTDGQN